ncbi:translocation/assembly module TamB domain-containing protein [Salipiger sp. 1_MG-2023]|uniref:translocation/assembly module TamB domain-containing protein n=1 Tax=Salipiger sp. 1_MG-2023 TaxID=3062665 RepID=UPI0026E485A0|nr:translocation/assembly module TamB domain-containing protein [Salipiger sp. 1_MG-2023]MDO6584047.1 translocation/assembly module TamB domain-containing protein [Salipiger sp. 1_MG-2023]
MKRLLLLLPLLFCLSLPAAAQDDDGGTALERLIENALSSDGMAVSVSGFRGALSSQATLERMTIADDQGVWLTLENATLDWSRTALLRGRVEVNELSAERLALVRLPASSAAPAPEASGTAFSLPDLPVSVNIGTFAIASLELGAPVIGEPLSARIDGAAQLADGDGTVELNLQRTDEKSDALQLSGSYANATEELTIDVTLDEAAGGLLATKLGLPGAPALNLQIEGNGPLDDFTADIALASDGIDRLSGQVTLQGTNDGGRAFAADLSGDLRPFLPEEQRAFLGEQQALVANGTMEPTGALDLGTLRLTTAQAALNGRARIGADGWPELLDLSGRIGSENGQPVTLPFTSADTQLNEATLTLSYDRAQGDGLVLNVLASGVARPDMTIAQARIDVTGTLSPDTQPAQIAGTLDMTVAGLDFTDASLAQATGSDLTGTLDVAWQQGSPLTLSNIDLSGAGVNIAGAIGFDGLVQGQDPTISPNLQARVAGLDRFSGLAGRSLGGAADLAIKGDYEPVSGRFDLSAQGTTTDLITGSAQLDGLMTGEVSVNVSAARNESGLSISEAKIDGQALTLDASGRLVTGQSTAQFDIALPDLSLIQPGATGGLTANGTLQEGEAAYALDLTARGPGGLTLDGVLTAAKATDGSIAGGGFTGTLNASDLSAFAALAQRELAGALNFEGTGNYTLDTGYFDAKGALVTQDLKVGIDQVDGLLQGTTRAQVDVLRNADGIVINDGRINGPGLTANASGTLLTGDSRASFDIALPDLSLVAPGASGTLTAQGTLVEDAGTYTLDLTAAGPGDTRIDGTVTADKAADGSIARVGFDGTADARQLAAFSDIAGRTLGGGLSFDGTGSYTLTNGFFDAKGDLVTQDLVVGISQIDGLLAGRTTANVDVLRDDSGIVINAARVDGPGIQLTAEGTIATGSSRASFDLTLPDLSLAAAGTPGSATATGTLTESADAYLLDFTAAGPGQTRAQGSVTATKTADGGVGTISFDGTAGADSLSDLAPLVGMNLRGSLSFDGTGSFTPASGAFGADGTLTTQGLGLGIPTADALIGGTGRAVIKASRDEAGTITVSQLDVSTGQITASASGSLDAQGGSQLSYDVALANLGVIVPQLPGRATAQGTLGANGSGPYNINTQITAPGGTQARIAGSLARDFATANLTIDGAAPLNLANSFIEPNLLNGIAQLNLSLNGPLAVSSLSGNVTVRGAEMVLPGPALSLAGLNLDAQLGGNRVDLTLDASLSTRGTIRTTGTIGLTAPYQADLAVQLQNLLLEDRRLYQATAGGTVTVQGPLLTGPSIGGDILIDEAEIRIPETGLGPGSRDFTLTHIAEPADVRATRDRAGLLNQDSQDSGGAGYVLPLNLTIRAPGQIFVRGRGLDAELGGRLVLRGTTADIVPEGRFELIRGRLDILGQRLTLDTATLTMTGDFIPSLDVEATTQRADTEITIAVSGEATSPEVSFSSSPSRPEEEVLALLLFGRNVAELSAFQALQIASAVNTLAGKGGDGIVGNLRKGFGLDDLDVTTDSDGNAALSLGKYITDQIYTDVEVKSSGETAVNLNIQLKRNLKAKASVTSAGDSGVGIYYEKDY